MPRSGAYPQVTRRVVRHIHIIMWNPPVDGSGIRWTSGSCPPNDIGVIAELWIGANTPVGGVAPSTLGIPWLCTIHRPYYHYYLFV